RALGEFEYGIIGYAPCAHVVVFQDEFFELRTIKRLSRANLLVLKTSRFRCSITVESGRSEAAVARPEPGADHLMRIGLARNCICPRARRRRPPRESSYSQVEATPKEMDRTRFAEKPRAKTLEERIRSL